MQNAKSSISRTLNPIANLRVRNKLMLLIFVTSLLTAFIGWRGISGVDAVNNMLNVLYDKELLGISHIKEANAAMLAFSRAERNYVLSTETALRERFVNQMKNYRTIFESELQKAESKLTTDRGRRLYADIQKKWAAYEQVNAELLRIADTEGQLKATDYTRSVVRPKMDEIDTLLSHLAQQKESNSLAIFNNSDMLYRDIRNNLLMLVIGSVVAGITLGLYIARLIARPISEITEVATAVASGNISTKVAWASADELGTLSSSFNTMIDNIGRNRAIIEQEKENALEASKRAERLAAEAEAESRYLAESVNEMLSVMGKFAQGDLTVEIHSKRNDDFARLCQGFNNAVGNIRDLVQQVFESVEQTASASHEISAATEQMAATAEEQSSQTAEIATAVEQMTRTIAENATNTTGTAQISTESRQRAINGGDVVRQTLGKMHEIAKAVEHSAETVRRLGQASTRIGEIISVIDEIADQTNLLALNAAIEAARAGEQGRGFAVVADEVRKLAERTVLATKEISSTITLIQSETANAVTGMEQGINEVQEGILLADSAGTALTTIVEDSNKVQTMISQIATATEEQSATGVQIAQSIESISAAAHQNAATVTQVATTISSLSKLTEEVRQLVLQFNINNESLPTTFRNHSKGKAFHTGHTVGTTWQSKLNKPMLRIPSGTSKHELIA